MAATPSISTISPSKADYILIPYPDKDQKKLLRFLSSMAEAEPSDWSKGALALAEMHKPDYKKFVEQWIGKQKIILMGIGNTSVYQKIAAVSRYAAYHLIDRNIERKVALILPDFLDKDIVSALSNGFQLSTMRLDYYKKDRAVPQSQLSIHPAKKSANKYINEGIELAEVQEQICHLVNLPSNEKNPEYLVRWSQQRFSGRDIKITILEEQALIEQGLDALYAVGKGSSTPPRLLVLQYQPRTDDKKIKHIGLVGKGVTFDTGGISLKDSLNMHLMKSDMGGAAAVLGIVDIIEKTKLPVRLTAVIPLAENSIGPDAYRPGDVIRSYNGKSIEIIDTDAEGRLILADAISYMIRNYKPEYIIDLATLTGSVIQTLGNKAAGLFTENAGLAASLIAAGDLTGERLWQLPLWSEYDEEMNSDLADIKNLATKPVAGAITAAKFLEAFTESHPAWAHLDIAGMAMMDTEYSKMRSATSYGVLLIKKWIEDILK